MDLDFPGLVPQLESGIHLLLVTDTKYGTDLNPDILRRFGGLTMLCRHYGTSVFFVNDERTVELGSHAFLLADLPSAAQ